MKIINGGKRTGNIMPQFDFSRRTPQGQVQASGPRDQGTGIRAQATSNLAQGVTNLAYGIQDIAKQRVGEQAESDMSAFQAERIRREQEFKEKSATITNAEEYRKSVDKYIADLDKYASGKREDGTKVFRNGMGSAAYKDFNRNYSAQFKAKGSEHAFQLDRKRDKLNYRMAINSGIKNNNPDAINQSYDSLVASGHLTAEEAAIEKERDIKRMTLNYFSETQAKMMLGVEETLNRVNQEQVVFDGTGIKPRTDSIQQASQTIKGSFETYKAEVYTNKNLNDQERKSLIDGAKASLRQLESAKKVEKAANKQAYEAHKNNVTQSYLHEVIMNPGDIVNIGKRYAVEYPDMDQKLLTKISNNTLDAHNKFQKAQANFVDKQFQEWEDKAIKYRIMSMPLNTNEDYSAAIDEVSKIGNATIKSFMVSWIKDYQPGKEKKDSVLYESIQGLSKSLDGALGLDLTRSQASKLTKYQRWGIEDKSFTYDKRPDYIPDEKVGLGIFVGGADAGYRTDTKNAIVNEYMRIYNTDGKSAADEFKTKAIHEAQSEINKRKLGRKYLDPYVRPRVR